jgi:hypothetical protein
MQFVAAVVGQTPTESGKPKPIRAITMYAVSEQWGRTASFSALLAVGSQRANDSGGRGGWWGRHVCGSTASAVECALRVPCRHPSDTSLALVALLSVGRGGQFSSELRILAAEQQKER